jgi:alpha-ketoglutarate-dependent taurine dioxygenase
MDIIPSGQALGARVNGIDLAQPLSDGDFRSILRALGGYGVLCFPQQTLDSDQFAAFGRRFGELEINVANAHHEPSHPEMMILSNMKKDGKQIGANDAGQGWHTVSAQLTAHSKFRRDGAGMVSTMNEVDTIDERSLKPIETGSCRRVAERPAPL